jgi:hypothetical protein
MKCLALLALLGTAVFSPVQADEKLSSDQLRQLFPGNFQAVVRGIVRLKVAAHGNGKLIGEMTGRKLTGSWRVADGKLCIGISTGDEDRSECSDITFADGWYVGDGVRFRPL